MATKIPWADETWNVIVGSSKVSAGCLNCYAEKRAASPRLQQFPQYREVITDGKWNGKTVFVESALTKPLHWRTPRKIFVCSMADLFHESVPFETIAKIFYIMGLCYWHQFFVLTKRSGRMLEMLTTWHKEQNKGYFFNPHFGPYVQYGGTIDANGAMTKQETALLKNMQRHYKPDWNEKPKCLGDAGYHLPWPLPNVHLGVTVENEDNVGRIADLRKTPAAYRFVSYEPLLGKIDSRLAFDPDDMCCVKCGYIGDKDEGCEVDYETPDDAEGWNICPNCEETNCGGFPSYDIIDVTPLNMRPFPDIDYAFIGCESKVPAKGKLGHRPLCTLDDVRYVMHQCREAGVQVHVKQIPLKGKCNKKIEQWPPEFQVREV